MKTAERERFPEGSIEDLRHSYGVEFDDLLELDRQATLQERQLTTHTWLGRILTTASGRSPARTEQRMQNNIDAARQALPSMAEDQYPHFEAWQPQATAEQSPGSAPQQLDQRLIPSVPTELVDYVPRHAAKE